MKRTTTLLITILLAIGMLLAVTGCNDSDGGDDNPTGPGNGTEIPDSLRGIWEDAASSTQYRFTEDNVQFYIKNDNMWTKQYDYSENGYDILYDGEDRVSIFLAGKYTIGFNIGGNGNLHSDGADLFMTKRLILARGL